MDSRIYAIATAKVAAEISSTDYLVGDKNGDSEAFKILFSELKKYVLPKEVTDPTDRTNLKNTSNFVNPLSSGDLYYPIMTLNTPSGYNEGDYYQGFDTGANNFCMWVYKKVDSTLKWTKIISVYNSPTS